MTVAWLILILNLSPVAQAEGSQDPIHRPDRVFTADEFRQKLLVLRGEKAILDLFQDSKIPPDKQKKLLDFAQSLVKENQKTEGKKDLPIPPDLLRNRDLQKILENEQLLEWLADNERIQEMAKRMAKEWKIPYQPNQRLPGIDPSQSPNDTDTQRNSPGPNQPNKDSLVDRSDPDPSTTDSRRDNNEPSPSATPPKRDEPEARPIEGLTNRLRRIRPLANSPTLNRIDNILEGSTPATLPETGPLPPSDQQSPSAIGPNMPNPSENPWLELWNDLPFVDNAPPTIGEIPLPPGLDQWIPSIDGISIPNLPLPSLALTGVSSPSLPNIPTSFDPTLSPSGFATPLAMLAIVAGLILLARYFLFAGWLEPASSRSRSNYKPRPPAHPFNPSDRSSIREWFEFAAFKLLGRRASSMSHADWQAVIDQAHPDSHWPKLYAQARYLPDDAPLDPNLTLDADTELRRLTGK
jgi:hypothetical protein